MKSITPKYIITRRKELSNEITKYWNIIKNENVIPTGAKRNFDLKALILDIQAKAEERILLKLYLQCINMGYKKFSELPITNNYLDIFTLSEKQEQLFHLSKIKTLDPKLKRAKGKKNLDKTEELTSAYISSLKAKLQLEINALNKKIEDFNNSAELSIEEAPLSLAA
jgi:aspartyl/asparaginyl-tRNA synthetase